MALPLLLLLSSVLLATEAVFYPCKPCRGSKCDVDPESCEWGLTRLCQRMVCAKGPGERCGGYMNIWGKCGEGLACNSCGYCQGCYSFGDICYKSDHIKCYT